MNPALKFLQYHPNHEAEENLAPAFSCAGTTSRLRAGRAEVISSILVRHLGIHTAAFVHVLVLLAAGLTLRYGESINLT